MKILIISDTHGQHRNLDLILEKIGPIDMLIHLGDTEGGEDYIRRKVDCPTHIIMGNNDFFSQMDREEEFWIGKYKVFITHGHKYRVGLDFEWLKDEGLSRDADIVMFGHTHKPRISHSNGLTLINPGSLSYPRQDGRRGSFIIMEVDKNGEAHYTLNYV